MFISHSAKSLLAPLNRFVEQGYDELQLLAGTGLNREHLLSDEARVTLAQELQMYRNLYRISGDPLTGLKIGQCYEQHYFGIWSYALMSAPSLRHALALAYRYIDLSFAFMRHSLKVQGSEGRMSARLEEDHGEFESQVIDRELSTTYFILCWICSEDVQLNRVLLTHDRSQYRAEYEKLFRCPVEFNAEENALVIGSEKLDQPLPKKDPNLSSVCVQQCEKLSRVLRSESTLLEQVKQVLLSRPGYFPDLEYTAHKLRMAPRSLRRRLKELDTSYRKQVDEVRFSIAHEYLLTTTLPNDQIAVLLGYSDTANFSHAFKRWSGESPSAYRRERSKAHT